MKHGLTPNDENQYQLARKGEDFYLARQHKKAEKRQTNCIAGWLFFQFSIRQ
jgi:hypothetical protein